MILPAQFIRSLCIGWRRYDTSKGPLVDPFHERATHNGLTYGLSPAGYDIRIADTVCMPRGSFALASSIERIVLPADCMAFVKDKSTWVRTGLCVQNTVLEPGWEGYLMLELTNHGYDQVDLVAGDPIAQLVFVQLLEATEAPYDGKYQDQPAGITRAIRDPESTPPCPVSEPRT